MSKILQVFLIICLMIFFLLIVWFISRKQLNIKYSLVWLFADFGMLVVAVFPTIVDIVSTMIGIISPVNTVFLFGGMFMVLILLVLTFVVSHLTNRIRKMAIVVSLLEKRLRDFENEKI